MDTVTKVVIMLSSVVLCMVMFFSPYTDAAITCGHVTSTSAPCISYLQKKARNPSTACCSGIKSLNEDASTTPDRQAACKCLKSIAGSFPGIDMIRAAGLPGLYGVNIPFKISLSTDCNKIS